MPERRPQSRRGLLIFSAVIVVLIAAAAAFLAMAQSGAPASAVHRITGGLTLTVVSAETFYSCDGMSGYGDIARGTGVTVRDGEGKILAVSSLQAGKSSNPSTNIYRCFFVFTVDNVPEVSFYSIEISHRGAISYSLADMKTRGWSVDVTLGR